MPVIYIGHFGHFGHMVWVRKARRSRWPATAIMVLASTEDAAWEDITMVVHYEIDVQY